MNGWKERGRDWHFSNYIGLRTIDQCRRFNLWYRTLEEELEENKEYFTQVLDKLYHANSREEAFIYEGETSGNVEYSINEEFQKFLLKYREENPPPSQPISTKLTILENNCLFLIAEIENLLSGEECDFLIRKLTKNSDYSYSFDDNPIQKKLKKFSLKQQKYHGINNEFFTKISDVYDPQVRTGHRLVVLEKKLSDILWERIKEKINFEEKLEEISCTKCPRGFSVLPEKSWKLKSVNECFRINLYQENNKFGYHRDSQYAPSANERSLFTGIIYLNDDFDGGNTNTFFPIRCDCANSSTCSHNNNFNFSVCFSLQFSFYNFLKIPFYYYYFIILFILNFYLFIFNIFIFCLLSILFIKKIN